MGQTKKLNLVFCSFNLSILECKSAFRVLRPAVRQGFNLSILECKFRGFFASAKPARSFNLSILECKYARARLAAKADGVLIYPYWNVNYFFARLE